MDKPLQIAYHRCLQQARSHYENFPVASWLVPSNLKSHIAAIYAFARCADDIADEAFVPVEQKHQALDELRYCLDGEGDSQYANTDEMMALRHTIQCFSLDKQYFYDLLDAFKQDVDKKRYQNFVDLLDYCRRSANPIGRLLLQLTGQASQENNRDSDLICSALQLINFIQDIEQDLFENDRVYLPLDEMHQAGVSITDLRQHRTDLPVIKLLNDQTTRAKDMLIKGSALSSRLNGRFAIEVRAIVESGLAICQALLSQSIYTRPRLTRWTKLAIVCKCLTGGVGSALCNSKITAKN